jgi:hypothetical protein
MLAAAEVYLRMYDARAISCAKLIMRTTSAASFAASPRAGHADPRARLSIQKARFLS